jgi:hypothetical protein
MILTLLTELLLLCVGGNKVESKAVETKVYWDCSTKHLIRCEGEDEDEALPYVVGPHHVHDYAGSTLELR